MNSPPNPSHPGPPTPPPFMSVMTSMPFVAALSWYLLLCQPANESQFVISRRVAQIAFCRRSSRPNNRWYYLFRKFLHLYLGQLNLDRDRYPWAAHQSERKSFVLSMWCYCVAMFVLVNCEWMVPCLGRRRPAPKGLSRSLGIIRSFPLLAQLNIRFIVD